MDTAIALLLFAILLLLATLGLVFSIFIMFLKAVARGRLGEGPPEEQPPPGGTRPPDEDINKIVTAVKDLVNKLVDKEILTRAEGDTIIGKLPS